MTEVVLDRGVGKGGRKPQVAVLSESVVRASLAERGFHFLRPKTSVLVRAEYSGTDQGSVLHMEPVELVEGVEVTLARNPIVHPGLPRGLSSIVVIPDSRDRRDAVKARDLAGKHWDVDAVLASSEAIRREDARLARSIFPERGNIDPAHLTRVQITAAKF